MTVAVPDRRRCSTCWRGDAPEAFAGLRTLLFGGEAVDPRCGAGGSGGSTVRGRLLQRVRPDGDDDVRDVAPRGRRCRGGGAACRSAGRSRTRTAYVLDGRLEPVPVGVPGELYLGGDGAGARLSGPAGADGGALRAGPVRRRAGARLYRTGDLVRWLADGTLEFLGRIDHQVKVRGFRIELGEIEAALRGARRGARGGGGGAGGRARRAGGWWPTWCARREGAAGVGALREHLRRSGCPEYMVPAAFVVLEALPLTPNGKVDRTALPAPTPRASRPSTADEAPRRDAVGGDRWRGIWAEVLRARARWASTTTSSSWAATRCWRRR